MSVPTYTYFIEGTEVHPGGEWSIKPRRADADFSYCKDYRNVFEGELVFKGDDYDLLRGNFCCDILTFLIKCDGVDYWEGFFVFPTSFEVDEDLCTLTGSPGTKDKYFLFDLYAGDAIEVASGTNYVVSWEILPGGILGDQWKVGNRTILALDGIAQNILDNAIALAAPTLMSTFFWNDLFPDGTNPYPLAIFPFEDSINYATGANQYLTGIGWEMTDYIQNLNVTAYPSWSWNQLMEILHDMINVWWYIDEQGDIRIEHIHFWDLYFGDSYDLEVLDDGKWIENSSKYRPMNELMPPREFWDVSTIFGGGANDFARQSIIYDCFAGALNITGGHGAVKTYGTQDRVSDLEEVDWNSAPDVDGWMFLHTISRGEAQRPPFNLNPPIGVNRVVWYDFGVRSGANHLNAHLSTSNLINNYYTYDRPFPIGDTIWSEPFVFESTARNQLQTEIVFPVCCLELDSLTKGWWGNFPVPVFGLEFLEHINTQYGSSEIYTASILDNGMMVVELVFSNFCGDSSLSS